MSEPEYQPSEEDILKMLHYLRLHLPEYATPEKAIVMLNHYHNYYKALEELDREEVEKVLQDLEDH